MAARKSAGTKKVVKVEIDLDTLEKLLAAVEALSEVANAWVAASDDPRARALKGRRRSKRR